MPTIKIKDQEVEIQFWREDVKLAFCESEEGCGKSATHVNVDDEDDVSCNKHRLEMSPGKRLRYIKIEDVPFKNEPRTASEVAFNGDDEDEDDDAAALITDGQMGTSKTLTPIYKIDE